MQFITFCRSLFTVIFSL